ncbi:MAG TPA: hypothetical protein VHC71_03675 [Hyphomicrobium sp.]|nr:hypothetical protein [Hyphomicrobium sp.]
MPSDKPVIAVPVALAQFILGAAQTLLDEGGSLVLGSPTDQLAALKSRFADNKDLHCQEFDWRSVDLSAAFFRNAYDRFHRLDGLLLGPELWQCDSDQRDTKIDVGVRGLLRCLDASLPYVSQELHVVVGAPAQCCEVAMSIAAMFLKAKLQFLSTAPFPTIRMTTISTTGTRGVPSGPPPRTNVLVQGQRERGEQHPQRRSLRRPMPIPA